MKEPNSIKLLFLTFAALIVGAFSAQATQIHGDFEIAGTAVYDSPDLATAKMLIGWQNVIVGNGTFDFTGLEGLSPVTMPYRFNPPAFNHTFCSVGGFTFELIDSVIRFQDQFILFLSGTCFITGEGFDTTLGQWWFSARHVNDGNDRESFVVTGAPPVAAITSSVPDNGTTAALLAIALFAIAALHLPIARARS